VTETYKNSKIINFLKYLSSLHPLVLPPASFLIFLFHSVSESGFEPDDILHLIHAVVHHFSNENYCLKALR